MTRSATMFDPKKYVNLLSKFNESGPYYTSYPALGHWRADYTSSDYEQALKAFFEQEGNDVPLHLYVHIPFCAKLCYYCICNMVVSNDREKIQHFLGYLLREIDMLKAFFDKNGIKPNFTEIHFGGGTPSHIDREQFKQLTDKLSTLVDLKSLQEFAMEIDPRTTNPDNLLFYASLGVQRISFGVQDFDPNVQKAINREQPYEMVDKLLTPEVRKAIRGVNFDLLFGLPRQTEDTFRNTLKLTKQLSPERVSLLKYAHTPDVRKHMKLIKDEELVSKDVLPKMFTESVQTLIDAGYEWVGIDYFAKSSDDLGQAVKDKTVWRTLNGFTPGRTNHILGIGPTSAGAFGTHYSQAVYENTDYFKAIDAGKFPVFRGYDMNTDEVIRREIMFSLLCGQEIDFEKLGEKYGIEYKEYFAYELEALKSFVDGGLISWSGDVLHVSSEGRFFLRNICKTFDTFMRNQADYRPPGPAMFRKNVQV